MAEHEKILFTVDKISAEVTTLTYFPNEVLERFVFRTHVAATKFAAKKNKRSKKFKYVAPERAVWGPDN